eukprot:1932676-Pyramimonas_sp.AAC.1
MKAVIDLGHDEIVLGDQDRVRRELVRHHAGHRSVSLIHCEPQDFSVHQDILKRLPEELHRT